jgi:hypothetical protein
MKIYDRVRDGEPYLTLIYVMTKSRADTIRETKVFKNLVESLKSDDN